MALHLFFFFNYLIIHFPCCLLLLHLLLPPSCTKPDDSGSWGCAGGPVPQWLWPWLCASLTLADLSGTMTSSQPRHSRFRRGMEGESDKGSQRGRSEKLKYVCWSVWSSSSIVVFDPADTKHTIQMHLVRRVWRPSGSRRWTQLFRTILRIPLGVFVLRFGNTSEAAWLSRPVCLVLFLTGALPEQQIKMT